MNLDFIQIAKFNNKDNLNYQYLKKDKTYHDWGYVSYSIKGICNMKVLVYMNIDLIKISGSLPYFINGHNFFSSLEDWAEGLDYLASCLNINLYSGLVECFEYGTIQEIPYHEDVFLRNHIKMTGTTCKEYKRGEIITGKEFENPSLRVKIYDVSRNIKNKVKKTIQEEISRLYGWDRAKHYIKIENHYKKPEAYFGGNVYLNELLTASFQNKLQKHLILIYESIMKTGNLKLPEKKADLNAGTLPLLILKELEGIYPFRTEDLLKAMIKAISDKILSPDDKKARMKILRENLKKISNRGKSEYDITELLQAKINQKIESG